MLLKGIWQDSLSDILGMRRATGSAGDFALMCSRHHVLWVKVASWKCLTFTLSISVPTWLALTLE